MSLNDNTLDRIHEIVANIHEMVAKEIIAQLRAELSRTQMAGCDSPLAYVVYSVITTLITITIILDRIELWICVRCLVQIRIVIAGETKLLNDRNASRV